MKSESISTLKTNILLLKTIEKWFPKEAKAVKLKHQGNLSFSQRKFDTAARIYSKAIEEGKLVKVLDEMCLTFLKCVQFVNIGQ